MKKLILLVACALCVIITPIQVQAKTNNMYKAYQNVIYKTRAAYKRGDLGSVFDFANIRYYYYDLNRDGKKELIIDSSNKAADIADIYTYKNNKVLKMKIYQDNKNVQYAGNPDYRIKGTKDFISYFNYGGYTDYMISYYKYKNGNYYLVDIIDCNLGNKAINDFFKKYRISHKLVPVTNYKLYNLAEIEYFSGKITKFNGQYRYLGTIHKNEKHTDHTYCQYTAVCDNIC